MPTCDVFKRKIVKIKIKTNNKITKIKIKENNKTKINVLRFLSEEV